MDAPPDANEMQGEKAKWELHKNATNCFEQILETALHKKTVVRPLISHLKNTKVIWTNMLGTAVEVRMNS